MRAGYPLLGALLARGRDRVGIMCAAVRLSLTGNPIGSVRRPGQAALAADCGAVLHRGLHCYAPGLRGTFATREISITYPDRSPAKVAFVAPISWPTGGPQVRLKPADIPVSGRPNPSLLAHELAHAAHFCLMPARTRVTVAVRYAGWLAARVSAGDDPSHAAHLRTSPLVAWLEAFGLFAERFDIFARRFGVGRTGAELHSAFLAEELAGGPRMAGVVPGYRAVDSWANASGHLSSIDPAVEGSVYSGVFLHRGSRRGLPSAVEEYLASARSGVLSLRDFRHLLGN